MSRLLPIFLLLLHLLACQPYEDGPRISFRSKDKRMTFSRPIASYTVDGVDSLERLETRMIALSDSSYERGMVLVFFQVEDPGDPNIFGYDASPYPHLGSCLFVGDDQLLLSIIGLDGVAGEGYWLIVRLSKTEAVFERSSKGKVEILSFIEAD